MNLDSVINLKMEKVLLSFEIQRLNSVLLDIEKKRMAMKNQKYIKNMTFKLKIVRERADYAT